MENIEKAFEILKALEKLPLDEMPVFTYDEAIAMKEKEWRKGLFFGILTGMVLTIFALTMAGVIH